MKLFMIAKSNIKKNRNITLTLIGLILFTTILLYISSSVLMGINAFLDKKNEELNGSDFIVMSPGGYEDKIHSIINRLGNCDEYEAVKTIQFSSKFENITQHSKSQSIGCLMLNADTKENIARLKIINQGKERRSNSIVLPYYLKVAKGYRTGDEIMIKNGVNEQTYIIYGFSEDIMFATPSNISFYKCYVYSDKFNELYDQYKTFRSELVKTKLSPGTNNTLYCDQFVKKANTEMKEVMSNTFASDYNLMKKGDSIFLNLIMAVVVVFSFIILMIALTVIRFAIVSYIEGNMKNIGAMEALGYTSNELILGVILQFILISFVGIILGFIFSIFGLGIMTNFVSTSVGLTWEMGVNGWAFLINLGVIVFMVITISYLAARKLKEITPLIALRDGLHTHNFRKNYLPLHKSPFHLNITIGLKTLTHNMSQNVIMLIIVSLMSFVCVFTFTTNYNFNIENTAFLRLVGIEKCQLVLTYYGKDAQKVFDEVAKFEHVKKSINRTYINIPIRVNNREVSPTVSISNDYKKIEINTIVNGRYPKHDNEIAITGLVLKSLDVKLGDVVRVGPEGDDKEFIIVGVTQHISNLGKGANITEEGMRRINPQFTPSGLFIYLDNKENIPNVTDHIMKKFSNLPIELTNREETFTTMVGSFSSVIAILCIACIIITLSIITLILYMLIKIKIMKERIRLGVSKALGYTTGQLIIQMIVSFCPICIIGALIGTILATYLINPAFAFMLSVSGIQNCHFVINPWYTVATFLSISLFSALIAALVSVSIRKITPRELFI